MSDIITGRVCRNGGTGQRVVTISRCEKNFKEGTYVIIKELNKELKDKK